MKTQQRFDPFSVALAQSPDDHAAAQALRYAVFVEEMGSGGALVDHASRREMDAFDKACDHLLLRDLRRDPNDQIVGVYRLMNATQAKACGGFSSAAEYDLDPLLASNRPLLELGRSCLHRDYRGGSGMLSLWKGLADHVARTGTEILFGVASFPGTNAAGVADALAYLHTHHLAPSHLRVTSRQPIATTATADLNADRIDVVRQLPALIKAYLRLGGCIGEGAFVDKTFNTTDVCMILDVAAMDPAQKARFLGDRA